MDVKLGTPITIYTTDKGEINTTVDSMATNTCSAAGYTFYNAPGDQLNEIKFRANPTTAQKNSNIIKAFFFNT